MEFDLGRVRDNVAKATTEDLLDRITVYGAGLEPDAVEVIMEELKTRGITPEAVVRHEQSREQVLFDADGVAQKCSECVRPAVIREPGWFRLFGKVPLFPKSYWRCEMHRTVND